MFDPLRRLVLKLARVPAEPQAPMGAPESIRVFRAGRNHYRLSIVRWLLAQAATLVGIIFSVNLLHHLREDLRAPGHVVPAQIQPAQPGDPALGQEPQRERDVAEVMRQMDPTRQVARQVGQHLPRWALPLLVIAEALGIAVYLLQLPITFAALRLDWELRWYMVTDRSLRIRSGVMTVRESTMSFANLQQVEVLQGPLQRLLGLADVRVQSAGGGGGGAEAQAKGHTESLHTGIFRGVEQATEVRDLILERLRNYRAAGLGDPDDVPEAGEVATSAGLGVSPTVAAAKELLAETRRLRAALSA